MSNQGHAITIFIIFKKFQLVYLTDTTDSRLAIGIDLGTTNSCVAVLRYGKVEVIANEQGNMVTPSYVSFNDHEYFVGDAAKNEAAINPENTVFDAKRLIGRKFKDPVVQSDMKHWPFAVKDVDTDPKIEVMFQCQKKQLMAEEVSAMVLGHMKQIAEDYLNENVINAVVTVPAYFNNAQRQATYDAGKIAGLNILRVINEPTAASIAYGFNNQEYCEEDINILVFDLGGGTFDVSIVNVGKFGEKVVATCGETHLGGIDFDCKLVEFCVQEFKRKHKRDLQENKRAICRLRSACERAKRDLSSTTETKIVVDAIHDGIDFVLTLSRARFEGLILNFLKKTLIPVATALQDARLTKADISKIVLVGGSTRIPKIQKLLQEFFDGKELDKTINPDEAVAHGAAIHAAALCGNSSEIIFGRLLQDVTPLSLGYGHLENCATMCFVIPRNTAIPARIIARGTTLYDFQQCIVYPICQGESPNAHENFFLGKFTIMGFPISLKGIPSIEIIFEIDANGILNVSARCLSTGITSGITIENTSSRIRTEQIKKMIKDAEIYRIQSAKKKNARRAKNALIDKCLEIKNTIEELSEKLHESEKKCVLRKCEDTLDWIDENSNENEENYERRFEEIERFSQKSLKRFLPTEN